MSFRALNDVNTIEIFLVNFLRTSYEHIRFFKGTLDIRVINYLYTNILVNPPCKNLCK